MKCCRVIVNWGIKMIISVIFNLKKKEIGVSVPCHFSYWGKVIHFLIYFIFYFEFVPLYLKCSSIVLNVFQNSFYNAHL